MDVPIHAIGFNDSFVIVKSFPVAENGASTPLFTIVEPMEMQQPDAKGILSFAESSEFKQAHRQFGILDEIRMKPLTN